MKNAESTTSQYSERAAFALAGAGATAGNGAAANGAALVATLADEMHRAWRSGERPGAEIYLTRHPELAHRSDAVLDLVYEEICLRHEYHEPIDRAELAQRFPAWEAHIGMLVDCVYTLETGINGGFPVPGETLGDFKLVAELGRGGQGRVFVAMQSSLGERPVVLKIAPRIGQEHLSLARLQHTHIVPLLSVVDQPDRNLRVLCMPYFGGLTLAAILERLQGSPFHERNGQKILALLDEARAVAPVALPPSRDPASPFLSRASLVQAVTWLGACLAEALKYAHERGLVHLDLKPSNILLTADRQPMLLDFHLARAPLEPGAAVKRLGGTPIYMSPEQKRAMASPKGKGIVTEPVDGRSDIYSLGLVLYGALAGTVPNPKAGPTTPLHQVCPAVSLGLSDIIAKCLAPDAKDRYAGAGVLAADFWGHLNDLPLKGVANRSFVERWRKWRRRKPHLPALFAMLAAVLGLAAVALALALGRANQDVGEARLALASGQKLIKAGQYDEAMATLNHGLSLLQYVPATRDLHEQLLHELDLAPRAKMADELHLIADRIRSLYGLQLRTSPRMRALDNQCRDLWVHRHLILDKIGNDLDRDLRARVHLDLLELAISGTNLHVSLAVPGDEAAARQDALRTLAEAEALFGPSAVLYHERALQTDKLGERAVAQSARRAEIDAPPRTAWEFHALGRSLLNEGNIEAAAARFDEAIALDPSGMWSHFFRGICDYRLKKHVDASIAFTVCTTLAPTTAACFYNRGLAFAALQRPELARRDFDRALALDPDMTEAAVQRSRLASTIQK